VAAPYCSARITSEPHVRPDAAGWRTAPAQHGRQSIHPRARPEAVSLLNFFPYFPRVSRSHRGNLVERLEFPGITTISSTLAHTYDGKLEHPVTSICPQMQDRKPAHAWRRRLPGPAARASNATAGEKNQRQSRDLKRPAIRRPHRRPKRFRAARRGIKATDPANRPRLAHHQESKVAIEKLRASRLRDSGISQPTKNRKGWAAGQGKKNTGQKRRDQRKPSPQRG